MRSMINDAGANLDGSMDPGVGRAALVGVDRPLLLMGPAPVGPLEETFSRAHG